ncbi:MAG TPA: hypothetical protein V6D47_21630 [Oscillatoriaceae cyanobacterium]
MTRDEILDLIDSFAKLKRRRIDRRQVPVYFLQNRIAVVLPAQAFTDDEHNKFDGRFQLLMTQRHGLHAYLDFSNTWRGLETPLQKGFT